MLWALVITVCLSHENTVECRGWRVEPFVTKYECQRERNRLLSELEETDHQYLHLHCERGHYS
jgi:hypothetical protein